MLRVSIMLIAVALVFSAPGWAEVRIPTGFRAKVGPLTADVRLKVHQAEGVPDACIDSSPTHNDFPAPKVGYSYRRPGRRGHERQDWTFGDGGYIQTYGAKMIRLFIMPDNCKNIGTISVSYDGRRPVVRQAEHVRFSETFRGDGFDFQVGLLTGVRMLKITIEYEDVNGNPSGSRSDCVTVDATRRK